MINNVFSEFNTDKTTYNDMQRSNLSSPPLRANLDYNINDTFTKSEVRNDFSADDGKISFKDKLKNFAKGIVSPITTMFTSPKNFAIGAVSIVGISALTAATGGAITPLLIASGVTMGGIQIAKSAYNASTATTDDEARQAWQGMGAGTTAVAGSVAGAKGALKASGVDTTNMSAFEATLQCFKSVPSSIGKSFNAFRTGAALTNIKNAFGINKKESSKGTKTDNKSLEETENIKNETKTETGTETKPEVKAEPKPETKIETKPEVKAETKQPETKSETKTETNIETKQEVKAEQKPEAKAEPNPETKTETKPEVKAEHKPEVKADSSIAGEVKTETKTKQPETKTEVKTEAKIETKEEVTAEHKPEVKAETAEANPVLSNSEQKARTLAKYKYGSDQEINQSLRLNKATNKTLEQIQTIDEIYDDVLPSKEEQTLYRGVRFRQNSEYADKIKNLKVGDTLSEDAYLSTTSDLSTAQNFADGENGYLFKIKMPKSSKTIDVESYRGIEAFDKNIHPNMNNESEFILQRGSNLKINNINKNGYQTIVECEYTGSTPKKVVPVNLNTPEEKLNFSLEKLYANPDGTKDSYMARILRNCIESGRNDDVYRIVELFKDRVSVTKNPGIFTHLLKSEYPLHNVNILSFFDSTGEYAEMIDLLNYVDSSCSKSSGIPVDIVGLVSNAVSGGVDLSTPCKKALLNNGFVDPITAKYYMPGV